MKIALETLGCKLNQAETEYLAREFAKTGHNLVSSDDSADIYILNTCTVTRVADSKARHLLRMAHRHNPDAKVVAIGCYAERAQEELTKIEGVDLVIGNDGKSSLLQILQKAGYLGKPSTRLIGTVHRTRSFIKIQYGCTNFCSYCIVPFVRGKEKSLPAGEVIAEINKRAEEGYREVVLTGTEVGSYSDEGIDLKQLLECILNQTEIARLRLSSLQPQEISPDFIGLWRNPRLCPHFHLSLQSGSDTVLKRMGRRYSTAGYRDAVALIRETIPDAAITTDIIAGFPGETEEEFEQSYEFCRQTGFARIHVFAFSPREGTAAARMPGQIDSRTKKERSNKMLALAKQSSKEFRQQFTGKRAPVLWEKQVDGIWSGLTPNYIKIYLKSREELSNRISTVELDRANGDGMTGRVI